MYPVKAATVEQYRQIDTSRGKVIVGLDKEKALEMFGPPASKSAGLWYYATPPSPFFVSFSETPSILLYPNFYQATVGIPMEFKAFLSLPDFEIKEITSEVQLIFERPETARLVAPGVVVPKKAGEYSLLAVYQKIMSNPLSLQVKEAEKSEKKELEKEKLLSIDLLPYRPVVSLEGSVDFIALGTFYSNDLNEYSVRDISQDVDWLMRLRPRLGWNRQDGYRVYFSEQGLADVVSKHMQIESSNQRVEIRDRVDSGFKRLKHILVLPESMIVLLNNEIKVRVFGTYEDNTVSELTREVKWKISDPEILASLKNGSFYTKSEGVTEVVATKDGLEGLPIKVAVVNKSAHFLDAAAIFNSIPPEAPERNPLEEIKQNVDKLKKDFLIKQKELKEIKIEPNLLEISLGEQASFTATGIYDDGSTSDLTVLGSWGTLDQNVARVSAGNVSSISLGQTSAYVEYKGVRSEYASVIVIEPRLVSLLLTPDSLRLSRDQKARLKVIGNYYDQSKRDLTEQVSWMIAPAAVVRIDQAILRPLKFGRAEVYAEYSKIRSNPASVQVVLTLGWLLWLLIKISFTLFLLLLLFILILYLIAERKRKKLISLKDDPRVFILELNENAKKLIAIFGLRYDIYTSPLFFAGLVQRKFLVPDNDFLNFTVKFEEAKYSHHVLQKKDLVSAVNDYNRFFTGLCKTQPWALAYYRQGLALLHARPILFKLTDQF